MHHVKPLQRQKSEDNCAKLAAALLKKYGLGIDRLYIHKHWYSPKYCPAYILPHWEQFKAKVLSYMNLTTNNATNTATVVKNTPTNTPTVGKTLYRIRKSWDNVKSQIGAYYNLDGAKSECKPGYSVYDERRSKSITALRRKFLCFRKISKTLNAELQGWKNNLTY